MEQQLSFIPEEPGYILDATVLTDIGRRIWPIELRLQARKLVIDEIANSTAISSIMVYNETYDKKKLESGDEVSVLLEDLKRRNLFLDLTEEDEENIARVLSEFPSFLKFESTTEDADPWLVALALRKPGWGIVTNDGSKDTPGLVKMHQVCRFFEIECMSGYEYYKSLGWQI